MSRNLTLTCILLLCFFFTQAQVFFNDNCSTLIPITQNCPDAYDAPITVSGLPPLGSDNFGLIDAYFDLRIPGFFPADVELIAPNGASFVLASSVEGINSFPNASGTVHFTAFRQCSSLPFHNEDIGQSPNNLTFIPVDDITEINDDGIDPNGTWIMSFCGLPDDFELLCATLTFGNVCPEITGFDITPPSKE
ncbi:MAG: hypothetical protein AAGK97_13820 [Bacteroidota bacterium]